MHLHLLLGALYLLLRIEACRPYWISNYYLTMVLHQHLGMCFLHTSAWRQSFTRHHNSYHYQCICHFKLDYCHVFYNMLHYKSLKNCTRQTI